MTDITNLFEWLLQGTVAPGRVQDLYTRVGAGLSEAGVPLDRLVAFIRTLHPHFMSRRFEWTLEDGTRVTEAAYSIMSTPAYVGSPVAKVVSTGKPLRRRLSSANELHEHAIWDELAARGVTDYLALPIHFTNGEIHTISFATKSPEGFSDEHIAAMERIMPPLSRIIEITALRHTAVNLLNTYVGRNAGERILAGNIKPGDTEFIQAVIWYSDLRGFTALSETVESSTLIQTLNEVFDCQVASIERYGGEVLKYIGDGLLAIFPTGPESEITKACDDALAAAREAFGMLQSLNTQRIERDAPAVRFGLALHIGEVAFGNIGGRARLDFTCIGPAVNLAARLEGLTGKLGRDIVTSSTFAAYCSESMEKVGEFALKGVARAEVIHAPVVSVMKE